MFPHSSGGTAATITSKMRFGSSSLIGAELLRQRAARRGPRLARYERDDTLENLVERALTIERDASTKERADVGTEGRIGPLGREILLELGAGDLLAAATEVVEEAAHDLGAGVLIEPVERDPEVEEVASLLALKGSLCGAPSRLERRAPRQARRLRRSPRWLGR